MNPDVTLKSVRATEIEFINKTESGTRIELESKYSYNVKYSPSNVCQGEFTVDLADKYRRDKFHLKAVIVGSFTYNPEIKKEKLHVETYGELFPYARAAISSLTVTAGLPPIFLPCFDIESQSIYKFEKNV